MLEPTLIQTEAKKLYRLGFNVFPMPLSDWKCMDWSGLRYTRMHQSQIMEAFSGRCHLATMAGLTSRGLIILQIRSEELFQEYLDNAQRHAIAIWAIKHPIGGQIWFRTNDEIYNTSQPDIQVRAQHRYTLVPPSSINGFHLQWVIRTNQKLEALSRENIKSLDTRQLIGIRQSDKKIPKYEIELREKASEENWTDEEIREAVYREHGIHIKRAKKRIMFWEAITAYMSENWSWEGKEGFSELATFCAIIRHLRRLDHTPRQFSVSQRLLAKLAHLQPDTVGKALERFRNYDPPILNHIKEDMTSNAYVYEFNPTLIEEGRRLLRGAETGHYNANAFNFIILEEYRKAMNIPDILENAAIGYAGFILHALLSRQPGLKTSQIAETLGFSLDQTKRLCRKLKEYKIIRQDNTFAYYACPLKDNTLENIIHATGVSGRTEARRRKILREQQLFAGQKIITQRKICDRHNMFIEPQ